MTDLAASDVTYTISNERLLQSKRHNTVSLAFGDGALTFPATGLPLTIGKLGCPVVVESLKVLNTSLGGKLIRANSDNDALLFYIEADSTGDMAADGGAPAACTVVVEVIGY